MEPISRSFEMRAFSKSSAADGETDFKGETAVFSTDERVEFLQRYAEYAGEFFKDPHWNRQPVSEAEARDRLREIKPQPLPRVRQRIPLTDWRCTGSRRGLREEQLQRLAHWGRQPGLQVQQGQLLFSGSAAVAASFAAQGWRFKMTWSFHAGGRPREVSFQFGCAVKCGLTAQGTIVLSDGGSSVEGGKYAVDRWMAFEIEVDLESGRYNLCVDGKTLADFIAVASVEPVNRFEVCGDTDGARLGPLWGMGHRCLITEEDSHSRDVPFTISTFLDETFRACPDVGNWMREEYDDSEWDRATLPFAWGGERHAGEDLYLRRWVELPPFERAVLNVETIDPAGEIWINGEPAAVRSNRNPVHLDVTPFLRPGRNLVAVRVRPNHVGQTMRHTCADENTGQVAGRMWLDLTAKRYLKDAFVYATRASAEEAAVALEVVARNDDWVFRERETHSPRIFEGALRISLTPWFPEELPDATFTTQWPLRLNLGRDVRLRESVTIASPLLWSPEHPQLYHVDVELLDASGAVVDDVAFTTGLRTVGQEGGHFRINGRPMLLNGALLFGMRAPLEELARYIRCSPPHHIVRDILQVRRMGGNCIRMSVHDGVYGGINDARYAEFADQMGLMFQWTTSAWVRNGSPWQLDCEELAQCIQEVRNHPSIVMWQPANHPAFESFETESLPWLKQVYQTIYPLDPSRLICPTANLTRLHAPSDDGTRDSRNQPVTPDPVWTAPMMSRGNMDCPTGYATDWSALRCWPNPRAWDGEDGWQRAGHRISYLKSVERAYFNFENEESSGQPNWNLQRGKATYRILSYELDYAVGNIGRRLTPEEWEISQAWQAFSAYESIRKQRWLGCDGFAWCTLDGGGNSGTYMKPLLDYYGHAKMAWYTVGMAYQEVLAGSANVDVVHGPRDVIPIVVLNAGPARNVDVGVKLKDLQGRTIDETTYPDVALPEGNTATVLKDWTPTWHDEGTHVLEYQVMPRA